jgi:hypothetical protein
MQINNQVGAPAPPCDTTANLRTAQHIPGDVGDPPLKGGFGTVNYGTTLSGTFTFVGGPLTGTAACTITLTPVAVGSHVTWTFVNTAPAVCNRTLTGVGT